MTRKWRHTWRVRVLPRTSTPSALVKRFFVARGASTSFAFRVRATPRRGQERCGCYPLWPGTPDGGYERSDCLESFAPLRLRSSTSCASSSNGCHALLPPFPPKNVLFSVIVLRPCVRVHPRLAQVPAMAVTSCALGSFSLSEHCALSGC